MSRRRSRGGRDVARRRRLRLESPFVKRLLRSSAALTVAALFISSLGPPVCFSSACSMGSAERATCKAMGRECCGAKNGQLSHAPVAPAPRLAAGPEARALVAPSAERRTFAAFSHEIAAPPAILQGVGLFTLFDVFLI